MTGQGRPPPRFVVSAFRVAVVGGWWIALWTCLVASSALVRGQSLDPGDPRSDQTLVGLRIVWGGGQPTTWVGSISPSAGRIRSFVPLGMAPEDNTTIATTGGRLRIQQTGPGVFNGCDVRLSADLDAKLQLEFACLEPSIQWRREVTLREILQAPQSISLDDRGNRVVLQRIPGDEIQVEFEQDRLIFTTGETTQLNVRIGRSGFSPSAEGKFKLIRRNCATREEQPVAELVVQSDAAGEIPPLTGIRAEIPASEGVYEWEFSLIENQKRGPFSQERIVKTRRIQWVAFAARGNVAAAVTPWEEAFSIDPTHPDRWTMRRQINQWKLPSLYPAPQGHGVSVAAIGTHNMIRLAPRGWQAIAIPIDQPGKPHVLEIEYLADEPVALGASLLEPNALGYVPPMGTDSGIVIPSSTVHAGGDHEPHREIHRITFWPSTNLPYLVLANHDDRREAVYGRIRVLSGPDRLEPISAPPPKLADGLSHRQRLMFLERPTFVQAMNAPSSLDKEQNQLFDDWTTVFTGADRLVQYLKANGYSGLALAVAAEGTAIYPSALIRPTPRWDGGVYFSSGQDPLRKDLLELLFRIFEREGLQLLPIVEFSGRLPALEQMRDPTGAADFDLVHVDGGVWDQNSQPGARPTYNPLHPAVQFEFERIIDELSARYREHHAFIGVGLGMQQRTAIAFPSDAWGWDQNTVQAFLQEHPALSSPFQNASLVEAKRRLLEDHRDAWVAWRARKMSEMFCRLQDTLVKNLPQGKLYVLPLDEGPDIVPLRALAGSLSPNRPATPLERWGIDVHALQQWGQVEVLSALTVGFTEATAELEGSDLIAARAAAHTAGVIMEHPSSWAHFEQFEKQSPFGSKTPIVRVQQLTPAGIWNRRRYAMALALSDASILLDGGSTPPLGQENSTQDWALAFAALPRVPFEDVTPSQGRAESPVVVRQFSNPTQSYFYAVNHSPWEIDLELDLAANTPPRWRSLTARELFADAGNPQTQLRCTLPPFEIAAVSIEGSAAVTDFRAQLPPHLSVRMQQEIQDLKAKLFQASSGEPLTILENPSFEPTTADDAINGWQAVPNSAGVRLDHALFYDGQAALSMFCAGNPVGVQSHPFLAPRTGRVSVSLWLRTQEGSRLPRVRLSLSENARNDGVQRSAELVPAEGSDPTQTWTQCVTHFDNLPSDVRDLTLQVDLLSEGTVWVDRIEIHDRWLDRSEKESLKQLLSLASYKLLEQGDSVGCLRILESYWPRFVDEQLSGADPIQRDARAREPSGSTLK